MTVLRTQGVESESPLAFAALQRLLWPLRKGAGGLPAPQRAALQAAFGEVEGKGNRFLAFLGTLSGIGSSPPPTAIRWRSASCPRCCPLTSCPAGPRCRSNCRSPAVSNGRSVTGTGGCPRPLKQVIEEMK